MGLGYDQEWIGREVGVRPYHFCEMRDTEGDKAGFLNMEKMSHEKIHPKRCVVCYFRHSNIYILYENDYNPRKDIE